VMKHILTILALCCAATAANAQNAALKPVPLPPAEFDHPYTGQVIVTKWSTFGLLRTVCKDQPTAIACTLRTYNSATGAPLTCLVMIGPGYHDNERVLKHEMGHCNGWSEKHEGGR